MPQVKFEKQISLSPEDTFKKIIALMDKAHELKKLDPDLKLTVQDTNMCVLAVGSKINGDIKVTGSGQESTIQVDLNIPWAYAPFKSIIKAKLEEKIEEMC